MRVFDSGGWFLAKMPRHTTYNYILHDEMYA